MTDSSTTETERSAAELRELLREAHGTIKDLSREVKEARSLAATTRAEVDSEYKNLLGEACRALADELKSWLKYATDRCPLAMTCPHCGIALAVLANPGDLDKCPGCGKRIMTKFEFNNLPDDATSDNGTRP